MSKVSSLKAESRKDVGTHATRKCRKNGMLPGIIYGHKQAALSVTVPEIEFVNQFRRGIHLFEVQVEGGQETVLVKDVQYNHLGTEIIHVDFARVNLNEEVTVHVPLVLKGTPVGTQTGGVLRQSLMDVEIECIVTNIPDEIRVNIAKLELGQSLHASEIVLPEGAKLITEPDVVVVAVQAVVEEVVAEAAPAAEGANEPEVISKGKEKVEGAEE